MSPRETTSAGDVQALEPIELPRSPKRLLHRPEDPRNRSALLVLPDELGVAASGDVHATDLRPEYQPLVAVAGHTSMVSRSRTIRPVREQDDCRVNPQRACEPSCSSRADRNLPGLHRRDGGLRDSGQLGKLLLAQLVDLPAEPKRLGRRQPGIRACLIELRHRFTYRYVDQSRYVKRALTEASWAS